MRKIYTYGKQSISWQDCFQVLKTLRSPFMTQGPKVKEFEQALCDYTGAKYCVVVCNGTAALHLAVLALGISKGDEGITSPITFAASANCILYAGGRVKFADIENSTANIDPEEIEKQITEKTKVIIPVHFAGQSCDMEKIHEIAKKHNLFVIEDAAQALGSAYEALTGLKAGVSREIRRSGIYPRVKTQWFSAKSDKNSKVGCCKYSDLTTFSFHPVKNITTGEGGAITTNNEELYKKLLLLRTHGITKNREELLNKNEGPWFCEQQELGFNYRITDMQCALGISQLKKLDKFVKRRREIVETYKQEFSNDDRFSFLKEKDYSVAAFHLFPLLINFDQVKINKKELFYKLRDYGLYLQVHHIPVHLHPYYKKLGFGEGNFPKAEKYYKQTISLPLYYSLKRSDIFYIVNTLKKIVI